MKTISKMTSNFPSASHLRNDEVDYELALRNYVDERKSELLVKQRLLRRLFQEDAKENREYRSPFTLEQEHNLLVSRVNSIEKAISKGPDPKLESRLKHYLLRIQRCATPDEQAVEKKNALVKRIRDLLETQGSKGISGGAKVTDNSGDESEARGGDRPASPEPQVTSELDADQSGDSDSRTDTIVGSGRKKFRGATPKKTDIVSREKEELQREIRKLKSIVKGEEEMQKKIQELENIVRGEKAMQKKLQEWDNLVKEKEKIQKEMSEMRDMNKLLFDKLTMMEDNARQPQFNPQPESQFNFPPPPTVNRSQIQPNFQFWNQIPQQGLFPGMNQGLNGNNPNNQNMNGGTDNRRQEPPQYDRKIEKWNISFSGDSKSTTLEDFIFKVKVLASMNGIPQNNLFSHIHLLLRGDATDWFFTYYEPGWDWATFEARIRFRFGNPNQDQGNRQRIYERKQQKGETFIAFVTDIERLNKLLTVPLSNERKFEIIWENMRQHYRSKLACFTVTTLEQLVQVNHRIDASDPSVFPIGPKHTVHNLEVESDEGDSDTEQVNVVDKKYQNQRSTKSQVKQAQETLSDKVQGVTRLPHCWNCRNHGHFWRECKETKTLFCYVCGNPGKVSSTCDSHPKKTPQEQASASPQNSGN